MIFSIKNLEKDQVLGSCFGNSYPHLGFKLN